MPRGLVAVASLLLYGTRQLVSAQDKHGGRQLVDAHLEAASFPWEAMIQVAGNDVLNSLHAKVNHVIGRLGVQ